MRCGQRRRHTVRRKGHVDSETNEPVQRRSRWLRGVRARLVITYLAAAAVLATGGTILFTVSLQRGLQANVDAGLQTRASALAADVAAGNVDHVDPGPVVDGTARVSEDVSSFTAVVDPSGRVVYAQPNRLPASPVTARPGPSPRLVSRDFAGAPFRILTIPVRRTDGTWLVVTGQSLESANETNANIRRDLTIAIPILLALAGLGAWLLSGAALRPVDRMRADAQRLSETSDRGALTEPHTRDSLDRLAKTFNQLLHRLHDSLDQQRSLVADAGHELRTPLAVLRLELETAVRPSRTRDDLVDSIEHAQSEVTRLTELAEDLLLLAQADEAHPILVPELTDIGDVIDSSVAAHRARAETKAIDLNVHLDAPVVANLDPTALRRILDNLLTNAVRHAPEGGHVWLAAECLGDSSTPLLSLTVRDDGSGFPDGYLPHAFDRFSRPDQGRSRIQSAAGTGLGLAVVKSLTTLMHGEAMAFNHSDGGAVVQIDIPIPVD